MLKKLGIAVMTLTIAEIAVFILLGNQVGILPTLLIIVGTGALGIYLSRKEGFKAVRNLQASVQSGQPPAPALIDAALTLIGGIILILPGFLTDILGIIFILPFTRKLLKPILYNYLRKKTKHSSVVIVQR
ncbi:FxsA family protein [Caryophanon tenue]|uniref:Membrane protein FxsA n=1 Tax=Caryophanon tenue TaxID=33978 RepID=A0A1C0YMG6_9BACL|nr:FxsA family protein [Caryophanon tenue]OCS88351.1 hypothetical protein A6M13_00460 [Caryophanon tenue]